MYEEMLLRDFEEALDKNPVAYIPCGLLEWHSSHLPLGIDGIKIEELGRRIAMKYGGVVLPPFYVGAPGFTSYQGTITYRPSTVKQVFSETFAQLIKLGFRVIVAIGGHYGNAQETCLKEAAAEFKDRNDLAIWVLNEADVINDIGIYGDHAGTWETSMGIELCGKLVDLADFKPGVQPIKRYNVPMRVDGFDFEYHNKEFVIVKDLKTCLDKDEIHRNVSLVVDRIGIQAQALLQKILHASRAAESA
ncbi:MAG: hypothetical protein A2X49_12565 [Lentisphaerae bacterium GWF2_52_8]|nr:MAG: hypothetical protein A2X49_12565 [Lentisphaerae bacterium GWF2_52_8]